MVNMNEFIKNTNPLNIKEDKIALHNNTKKISTSVQEQKYDSFESKNKIDKKKRNIIIASIITAIAAIAAFLNRKNIYIFFQKHFKKQPTEINPKENNIAQNISDGLLKKPDNADDKIVSKTEVQTTIKKELTDIKKSQTIADKPIQTPIQKPSFPTPDFKDNPTKIQKFEYIESIKKYLETSDKELNLKAIEAVGKYGAGEQADKLIYFATADDDELVQAAEKAYKNLGDSARLYEAFSPIQGVVPYNDETYIVTLDTINALINPKTDKEDLKFISKIIKEKLLNHKSDKVRNLAQTLFDKLNSMI